MSTNLLEQVAEIRELARHFRHPFPYADCRRIRHLSDVADEDFIPDLDTYFFDIWSACNGIRHVLRKSKDAIKSDAEYFAVSLDVRLVKHKHYLALVSPVETPDLFSRLKKIESMREKLLKVLLLHLHDHQTDIQT